jgi:hypothetical protein
MEIEEEIKAAEVPAEYKELYMHLRARIRNHQKSAVRRNEKYKRWTALFRYFIPLASVSLTIIIAFPSDLRWLIAAIFSILLTIGTAVDSAMRSKQRYTAYVMQAIELEDILFDFELGVHAKSGQPEELCKLLIEISKRVSQVGQQMSRLPVPSEVVR